MSIQQTVNQGLMVAAALGTQTPQYQEKIAKKKEEAEYNKLTKQIDLAADSATERNEKDETPEAFDKVADLYEKRNLMRPDMDNIKEAAIWRKNAQIVRDKIRDIQKQEEANAYAEAQKQAAEEQRKKIRETIMRV